MSGIPASSHALLPSEWTVHEPDAVLARTLAALSAEDGLGNAAGISLLATGTLNLTATTVLYLSPGAVIARQASAPDSALIGQSEFGLWLDATPGATKLMVKAKDSGGTVRTAAIALA